MSHQDVIHDQFSRQAVPFSEARSMADADAIQLLIDAAQAAPGQRSLVVACGPGLVALAFAGVVREAVGLDTTQAMLDRARVLQVQRGIANVAWVSGEADKLPFPDGSFDAVTCRFAFHHMLDPAAVLSEMKRAAKPGGRIVVCDGVASDDPSKAQAFNDFERMRDPSTVRFLTAGELHSLFAQAGFQIETERTYRVPAELEALLKTSFPAAEDIPRLRETVVASLSDDRLGMATRRDGDRILLSYPALILSATRSGKEQT